MTHEESRLRLKTFRAGLAKSQSGLAKLVGCHVRTVVNFESVRENRLISRSFADALHTVTGVSVPWLLGDYGEAESPVDLIGRPYNLEFFSQWQQAKGFKAGPLENWQKGQIWEESARWLALYDAAARVGKFELARAASENARQIVGSLTYVSGALKMHDPGPMLETNPEIFGERSDKLAMLSAVNFLRDVASIKLLHEAGQAIKKHEDIAGFVKLLREAADRLETLPHFHNATKKPASPRGRTGGKKVKAP